MKKKIILPLFTISLSLLLFSCNKATPEQPKEDGEITRTTFYLNYSATEMYVGTSITLAPKTYKSKEGLTWFSSNKDIASVDENGNVTALKVGEVVISAYDELSAGRCTINIIDYDETYFVTLSSDSFVLNVGEEYGVIPTLHTNDRVIVSTFTATLLSETVSGVASVEKIDNRFVFTALKSGECVYSFVTTYNNESYGANVSILVN